MVNVTLHLEWEQKSPFLCSDQLSQQDIIGHNFCTTPNIGTV